MEKILVKISGEYFGTETSIFDKANVEGVANVLKKLQGRRHHLFVVVGGGNICRGRELSSFRFVDGAADKIGMLSTAQNALILKHVLDTHGVPSHVMAPFAAEMLQIHPYQAGKAKWWAKEGPIVIFGGGLGQCGFSTDMTSVCRAFEVGVKTVIKVTEVGGLFTADPKKDEAATLIPEISFNEVIEKGYQIMDEEAFVFAKNKKISIKIMNLETLSDDFFLTKGGTIIR